MSEISPENINLAQYVGKIFGDNAQIAEHLDEQQNVAIRVLSCVDIADAAITSYATIGLSDYKLGQDKSGTALGTELVARVSGGKDYIDRALAEVAQAIRTQNLLPKPGVIFTNALSSFSSDTPLAHFLFTVPSMWDNQLYPLQFKAKTVLWLQAIPIGESEKQYAEKNGASALGEKLMAAQIDLTELSRPSVI